MTGAAAAPAAPAPRWPGLAPAARLARGYVLPYRRRIAAAAACMVVAACSQPALAWLMESVVGDIFIARDREALAVVPLAVLAVMVAGGLANFGQTMLMSRVSLRVVADLQTQLFDHLMRLDLAYFQRTPTGRLIGNLISDSHLVRNAAAATMTALVKDLLMVVLLTALMFYQNAELALAVFGVFLIAWWPIDRVGKRTRKAAAAAQEAVGSLSALVTETVQGARHVKAYGMEAYETARAQERIESVFRRFMTAVRVRAANAPVMEALGGVAAALVLFYGGAQVIDGAREAGGFFAFVTAMTLAYRPLKSIANLYATLQEGIAAAQRLFAVLDERPNVIEAPAAAPLAVRGGSMKLKDVRFSYRPGIPALKGISLAVPAGATVALVGPSGAGKSTVFNLVARFFDVDSGRVEIDGQDVRGVALASLRAAIAPVSQDTALFNDTVRANIAYGAPGGDAAQADIEAAARAAAAHEFVSALPQGYDTTVGERGVELSGGERQRIAIARAVLKNAPILLLDEATASLDTAAERQVQAALERLKRGRTTLAIAHRLSTVRAADRIYVLDEGRVVEEGAHAALYAAGRLYARLYDMQFADPAAAAAA